MKENIKTKSDPHDHHDQLPKDVLNNEQDPESFRDPLEVQLAKEAEIKRANNEQPKKKDPDENSE